jgi:hypothetical protein
MDLRGHNIHFRASFSEGWSAVRNKYQIDGTNSFLRFRLILVLGIAISISPALTVTGISFEGDGRGWPLAASLCETGDVDIVFIWSSELELEADGL